MPIKNRRSVVKGAAASLVTPLTGTPSRGRPASRDANAVRQLDAIADELLVQWPEQALMLGLDKGPRASLRSRFGDRSRAASQARFAWNGKTLAALRQIDRTG